MTFKKQTLPNIEAWEKKHGCKLEVGLFVNVDCSRHFGEDSSFEAMITIIACNDDSTLDIGVNESGKPNDFSTCYDGFALGDLEPIKTINQTPEQ